MAELTATELETKIAAIEALIEANNTAISVLTAADVTDYSIGQKSVTASSKISSLNAKNEGLMKQLEFYYKRLDSYPAESYQRWAISTSDKGDDESEYLGEIVSE